MVISQSNVMSCVDLLTHARTYARVACVIVEMGER